MQLTQYQKRLASWLLIGGVCALVVWLLAPVLMPFAVAGVLAYALSPLVDRVDAWFRGRMPRWLAVLMVEVVFLLMLVGVFMLVVPLFIKQVPEFARQLPALFMKAKAWLEATLARYGFVVHLELDLHTVAEWIAEQFQSDEESATGKDAVSSVLSSLVMGGNAALSILGNLALIPLALYYLLLDWDRLINTLYSFVPPRLHDSVGGFFKEADVVLGQYLRGQLLVMVIMALFFSIGLMLFGLNLAWPIGIFTGLAMFVPYVGFAMGMVMAFLVGIMQLGLAKTAMMVLVVYGAGQVAESFFLTPRLVGERIGLHPLAVIFALLAFGQLFGFVGILLALPTSAVLLVAIRRLRASYFQSNLYKGS